MHKVLKQIHVFRLDNTITNDENLCPRTGSSLPVGIKFVWDAETIAYMLTRLAKNNFYIAHCVTPSTFSERNVTQLYIPFLS